MRRLERFNPNHPDPKYYAWIPFGIMYDMEDSDLEPSETGVRDGVGDYTLRECHDAMDPDVLTIEKFCERVLQENGNKWWAEVVDLFEDYGHNNP